MKRLFLSIIVLLQASLGRAESPSVLTLAEARSLAIKNHPRISAAEFRALAAKESTREARSAFFPTITANATAVGTGDENTRIAAGSLSNPAIYERNAEGLSVTQLITDFGRTGNLTASASLRAQAAEKNELATRSQVLLLVDTAYFNVLQAQVLLNVAKQTVSTRELLLNHVAALATNKLKSELDVNFARVTLDEGRLLLLRSENDLDAAMTRLSTLLGFKERHSFELVNTTLKPLGMTNVADLVETALRNRPELVQQRLEWDAAKKFAKAERALHYPTISAVAGIGVIPEHSSAFRDDYAAAGVNLSLPIFAGGLHSARQKEAEYRAEAAGRSLEDAEHNIIREVRIAWLGVNSARERLAVTGSLLQNAVQAYALAEARYNLGGVSIVELSQAQLNKTAAEIAKANAQYDYEIQQAVMRFQIGDNLESNETK